MLLRYLIRIQLAALYTRVLELSGEKATFTQRVCCFFRFLKGAVVVRKAKAIYFDEADDNNEVKLRGIVKFCHWRLSSDSRFIIRTSQILL